MTTESETTLPVLSVDEFFKPITVVRLLFDGQSGIVERCERVVTESPLFIGRAVDEIGLKVGDRSVSRQHARIVSPSKGGDVVLENMSGNGSFVNGERVETAILHDGDIVRTGNSLLLIRHRMEQQVDSDVPELVGDSPVMGRLRRDIAMVAPSKTAVLIAGQTGTGKELVARAVHRLSGRTGPFVPVNCAAIPTTLAESQLFGHVAGSFTGAKENHGGFFRQADNGTLFLDEVGELPQEIQPKLLRALEDHAVIPVGSVKPIPLNIRIVAATNRDLEEAVDSQVFRADLYARLAEFAIHTPSLLERREDILPLFRLGYDSNLPPMAPDLVEMLLLHSWRYNVRELFKLAAALKIEAGYTERLELFHAEKRLGMSLAKQVQSSVDQGTEEKKITTTQFFSRPQTLPEADRGEVPSRESIEKGLALAGGNVRKLSRIIGKSRRQTYRYLDKYKIDPNKYRD